ncbi:MAG: GC-type dockerin domain-anchored protein [Phycisphaerales bacterium]|jgi:hypothetical protein|nr:GC-type dockerin domain-anchored protein [Phycisphaerales bacterium]
MDFERGLVVVACSALVGVASAQQVTFRTVALSGQQSAGLTSGVTYANFQFGVGLEMSNTGRVQFLAELAGPGVTLGMNEFAYFREDGSQSLELLARRGGPAGGVTAGIAYAHLGGSSIIASGKSSLAAVLSGAGVTSSNDVALINDAGGGGWDLVARKGDPAPGLPVGTTLSSFSNARMNDSGEHAFFSFLSGPGVNAGNNVAMYFGPIGGLTPIARLGDPAPGLGVGVTFSFLGPPVLADLGRALFTGGLAGPGVTPGNSRALFAVEGAAANMIVRNGDPAFDLPTGVVISSFLDSHINRSGTVTFVALLAGTGVSSTNDQASFREGESGFTLVARTGRQAAGLPAGVNYSGISRTYANAEDRVVFYTFLDGVGVDTTNDRAIFSDQAGGGLVALARKGDQAPGHATGVVYADPSDFRINDADQVVFSTALSDGVNTFNGFFAVDASGAVRPIVFEGQMFDVNDDPLIEDLREIASLRVACILNDRGEHLFTADFADGTSGVFIATIPTACPGDWDGSGGQPNSSDFLAYLNDFSAQDPRADLAPPGGNGSWDSTDFLAYLNDFAAGC